MHGSEGDTTGTLYMVATPIGNLDDITLRALEVLKSVDAIACEDTRHSRRLLEHYQIRKPLLSAHSHNEEQGAAAIVRRLVAGEDVAYVSDAGSPGVSDPGRVIVRAARDASARVVPLPGPSAITALMSANGFPGKAVTFEGFLSPKQGRRRKRLLELLEREESFVLYESPHRVLKLLADLSDLDPERQILLGRELTKLHEELLEGAASEVLALLSRRDSIKGEIAILVGPPKKG
jgi:16S rRNA (cytidine1402-2'-O)-methyltransferase